ncbi:MAG: hypothetical protein GPJ51_11510 [Candidatus Heimdallarchaeota archaeon]|nr:hypothetical protein [Candidatus Heimdallarchaeota archaeon]
MSKKEKPWKAKEVDDIQSKYQTQEDSSTQKLKVNWVRIALLGFFSSLVFVIIDVILILSFYFGFDTEIAFILFFMQYVIFGEAGLVIFIGACFGNFGQSTLVSNLKERLIGSDPISKDSFREATFNSFTYYFGGGLLILYGLVLWQILRLVILLNQ